MLLQRRTTSSCTLLALTWVLFAQPSAWAVVPSEQLMSPSTRGYASISDINLLQEHWQQTQLGQLVQDETMQPFVEDMKRQLKRKISGLRDKLGLELADLKDVAGGEIGLGLVERENERAAVSVVVDVTDHRYQLNTLLKKIDQKFAKLDAAKSDAKDSDTEVTTYVIPPEKEGDEQLTAVFFVKENMLCASDSALEAKEMLDRFSGNSTGLAGVEAYQSTMARCSKESKGLSPELRWYFDPFGYVRSVRSFSDPNKKRHGKDYMKILSSQGFDAIKGIGGFVNLSVAGSYEILHRTSVYAPAIPGAPEKYRLAMRMMKFPNRSKMSADKWIPRGLASYRTFSCDLTRAFEHFGSLFDAFMGYEEAFANVLEGLEVDPYGPQVDVRKDFIAHLGQRVTLVTDYELPITTKSERFLFAVEVTDEAAMQVTVEKFMKSDPNASATQFDGKLIWEIQEAEEEVRELDITVSDLDLLDPVEQSEGEVEENGKRPELLTSAVCVANGHLFIASHASFMKKVFSDAATQAGLSNAGDYREVESAMALLLSNDVAVKSFLRTDEAYRPIYELLRQGKMPESETLLGRVLNRLLTPADEEDEGILREQRIDGRQLPDFEMVRRYFGPAGTFVRSEDDGWFVVGATLSKIAPQARATGAFSSSKTKLR